MSFGKMNGFADIVENRQVKDSEGFTHSENEVLASVRVYREGRHGSQRWANLAAFSEATDLFRFRCMKRTGLAARCSFCRRCPAFVSAFGGITFSLRSNIEGWTGLYGNTAFRFAVFPAR